MMITTRKNIRKRYPGFRGRGIRKAAVSALVLVFAAVLLPGISLAEGGDIIAFKDGSLKSALLDLPGADADANKELSEAELAALTGRLDVISSGIKDITGMQFATGLAVLDLSGNKIRDISCLGSLVSSETHSLTDLNVSHNYLDLTAGSGDMEVINALISAGCNVVYEPQDVIVVEGITLDKTSLGMCVGDAETLHAVITPEDAADQSVTWSSDNEDTVSVTAGGLVQAKAFGTANITVTTNDGGFTAVCAVAVKDNKLSSPIYTVNDGYVTNVNRSTVVDVFKSCFTNDYSDLRVFRTTGKAYDKGIIGTGMKVKLYIGGTLRDEATILLNGDASGDGLITISDYTLTRLDILGMKPLGSEARKASDLNGDGSISISDYTLSRLDILGLKPISRGALPGLPEVTDTRIRKLIDTALAQIGKPYVFGANGPNSFDCSGFVIYCINKAGYKLGDHTANTLGTSSSFPWPKIDKDKLEPGDLMFYLSDDPDAPKGHIGHVGMYLGNGYHIHASSDYHHIVVCRVNGWYSEQLSHGRRVFN